MHIAFRSPIWARGRVQTLYRSVYQRSFLTDRNLASSFVCVRNEATVDAFSGMIYSDGSVMSRHCHIIQREASALLFLLQWAMREPLSAGRVTIQAFTLLFINQSVQSGRPTEHGNTIMKEDKNEELQSRRDFFKKGVKKVLPILGAALLSTPIARAVNTSSGCSYCSYTCKGSCQDTCKGNCTDRCSGSCSGSCTGDCYGTCNQSCYASNTGVNYGGGGNGGGNGGGSCSDCSGGCKDSCRSGCKGSCSGGCGSSCKGGCKGGMFNDLYGYMQYYLPRVLRCELLYFV